MSLLGDMFLSYVNPQALYDREYNRQMDQAQGLIGEAPYRPVDDIGPTAPGSGLLGGQLTQPQYAAQLSAIPMFKTQGTSLLMNQNNQAGAMDRQQQQQGWQQNNMTAAQQHRANIDQQQLAMNQQQNQMDNARREALGGYSGLNQRMQTMNTEAAAYEKNVMPYRTPIEYADRANDMIYERGGVQNMTPADDQALVVTLQKSMKQNESVMGDDFTTTINNRGGKDYIQGIYNKVLNGDALTETQRVDIVNLVNDISEWYKPQYTKRRKTAERRAAAGNLNPETYMQPALKFERMERLKRPGEKDKRAINNMPSDVQPVRAVGRGRNR